MTRDDGEQISMNIAATLDVQKHEERKKTGEEHFHCSQHNHIESLTQFLQVLVV